MCPRWIKLALCSFGQERMARHLEVIHWPLQLHKQLSILYLRRSFLQEEEDKSTYLIGKSAGIIAEDQFSIRGAGLLLGID